MRTETTSSRRAATAIAIALAMSVSACAHVGQDQFDAEIASLRSQMEQGDEASGRGVDEVGGGRGERLEERSGGLNGRVQALTEMQVRFEFTVQRL